MSSSKDDDDDDKPSSRKTDPPRIPLPVGKKEKQQRAILANDNNNNTASVARIPGAVPTLRGLAKKDYCSRSGGSGDDDDDGTTAEVYGGGGRGLGQNRAPLQHNTASVASRPATVATTSSSLRGLAKNDHVHHSTRRSSSQGDTNTAEITGGGGGRGLGKNAAPRSSASMYQTTDTWDTSSTAHATIRGHQPQFTEPDAGQGPTSTRTSQSRTGAFAVTPRIEDSSTTPTLPDSPEAPEPEPPQPRQVSNSRLVEAMPVQDHDQPQAAAVLDNTTTSEGDPKNSRYSTWVVLAFLFSCACLIAIVVGTICGSGSCRQQQSDDGIQFATLTERDTTEGPKMILVLEKHLGEGYFQQVMEEVNHAKDSELGDFLLKTRQKALDWIVNQDPLQLLHDADNLEQRFLLVHLYFQTTRHQPWRACNPPAERASSYFFCDEPSPESGEIMRYFWGDSWVSQSHECHWAGVTCNEDKQVTGLRVYFNGLNGPLPWEIGQLAALTFLDLCSNMLTGALPPKLLLNNHSSALRSLRLDDNELSGSIPSQWFVHHSVGNGALVEVSLSSNALTGSIPSELGLLSLQHLRLSNNTLTGTLPIEVFHMSSIAWFFLGRNLITGSIPSEVGLLTKMEYFMMGSNAITGSVPSEIGLAEKLLDFDLSSTNIHGTLPEIFFSNLTSLTFVSLNHCDLFGTISSSLGMLTNLKYLHIANNRFHGPIPNSITALTDLRQLVVNGNDLTGSVPALLCETNAAFQDRFELVADCLPNAQTGVAAVDCDAAACCTKCCDETGLCRDM